MCMTIMQSEKNKAVFSGLNIIQLKTTFLSLKIQACEIPRLNIIIAFHQCKSIFPLVPEILS